MNTSANKVIDRIGVVINAKSDSEICNLLNLKKTTLSTWRGRDSVPYALCVDLAQKKGITLDWLLTGEGPMYRDQIQSLPEQNLSQRHTALLSLFDAVSDEQQREILAVAKKEERLNAMQQQLGDLLKKLG